ncbi:MAG: AAA family ATPase [Actinomycetota bacterium]
MNRPIYELLREFLRSHERLCVVKAPPGSGKSHNLLEALDAAVEEGYRIAIAAQTYNQVDDLCRKFCKRYPGQVIVRFSGATYQRPGDLPADVQIITDKKVLPGGPCIVVGTVAKMGLVDIVNLHDLLFIDEAWQMTWADFLTLRDVAQRYVMIGDPGQIPPTVTIEVDRWEVSPVAPHAPAPDVVLNNPELRDIATVLELDVCRRLPADSVDLVRNFYDFHFDAHAEPGERFLRPGKKLDMSRAIDRSVALLGEHSTVILTHPTDEGGIPVDPDEELAEVVASVAVRLLELGCVYSAGPDDVTRPRTLEPGNIGIVSTHNLMNSAIERALPAKLRSATGIKITTPERWQGLERPVMIAVHPLSGVSVPSSFDLETGRLCVMASRHQSACIFVTRDHVGETLDTHLPVADQALGQADIVGRGHKQHTDFWRHHAERNLIV